MSGSDSKPRSLTKYVSSFEWAARHGRVRSEAHYHATHVPLVRAMYAVDPARVAYYTGLRSWSLTSPKASAEARPPWRITLTWTQHLDERPSEAIETATAQLTQLMRQDIPSCLQDLRRYRIQESVVAGDYCALPPTSTGFLVHFANPRLNRERDPLLDALVEDWSSEWADSGTALVAVDTVSAMAVVERGEAEEQVDTGKFTAASGTGIVEFFLNEDRTPAQTRTIARSLLARLRGVGVDVKSCGGYVLERQHDERRRNLR